MKSLSQDELSRLLNAAKENQIHYLAILIAFNHGLRVTELITLRGRDFKDGYLTVHRLKGSLKTTQPLLPNEKELLKTLYPSVESTDQLFDFGVRWFQKLIKKYGKIAGIPDHKLSPHKLKHTTAMLGLAGGMKLNELQKYLGHKSLASTGQYLVVDDEVASQAFRKAVE